MPHPPQIIKNGDMGYSPFYKQQYSLLSNEYVQAIQQGLCNVTMYMVFPIIAQAANKRVRNSPNKILKIIITTSLFIVQANKYTQAIQTSSLHWYNSTINYNKAYTCQESVRKHLSGKVGIQIGWLFSLCNTKLTYE